MLERVRKMMGGRRVLERVKKMMEVKIVMMKRVRMLMGVKRV